MNDRKYTFAMFAVGFIKRFFVRHFSLFVPGAFFMIMNFFDTRWLYLALVVLLFDAVLSFIEEMEESSKTNQIYLDGYICKEPVYRKTPLGREIADLLLAVNRPYGKSDYIPCICWGRNARYAEHFKVGERCAIWGRIQSREYMKKLDEENMEKRVAFEVSVSKLELLEDARESIV